MDATRRGALSHLRVLDLTGPPAAYCGKLLADLGSEVWKIEAPDGDPGRRVGPWLPTPRGRQSLPFVYANGNKRSLSLDLENGSDRDRFRTLAAGCDLILESGPVGWLAGLGLSWAELSVDHPGLVLTSITGFGQTGPRRAYRSNDLVASAMGGAMVSIGHPEDPPVRLAGHQADVTTASLAAASSLVALRHRDRTGEGQHVDVSSLEVIASITHIAGVGKWLEDGIVPRRVGTGLVASVPSGAYRCRDGLVYLMVNRPAHWEALADWIHEVTGNEEVLLPEFRGASSSRLPYRELLDVFIGDLMIQSTVQEAYHEGQRRHIAVTPVQSASDIVRDEHLGARGFFVDLDLGDGTTVAMPGAPYRLSRTPWSTRTSLSPEDKVADEPGPRTPASGRTPFSRGDAGGSRSAAPRSSSVPECGALDGLRIVEFGTGLAAPWIGRILAWAGAEVVKIESHGHPDVPRLFVPPRNPEQGTQPECSPWFTDWSAGKRFAALDLRKEEGAELARRIVDESDAVIANYSNGVLEKLGLGYENLAERNPKLVMLESTGFGESGPQAGYVTWGPNIEALSGLCRLSGFADRDCTISHFAYPDPLSALHGLVALLAALAHTARTGQGQAIRLSQFETSVAAIGPLVFEAAATGGEPPKLGNGERDRAPWAAFPCLGEDRWCVVCVEGDADWVRFRAVMGEPEWAADPRFETAGSRVEHARDLEARIGAWTAGQRPAHSSAGC